jgi:NAD-dependent dihydropyrimidine dehydrogenase PreA subunit
VNAKKRRKVMKTVESLRAPTQPRWYPVVDESRCVNCRHCLQFCLFGVYALDDDGKVFVNQPDECKDGCPACSRVCPQSAIMFPLYEKDDAIAGAPGKMVAMDADARRMFYLRTEQPCKVCGRKVTRKPKVSPGTPICPECGGPMSIEKPAFDDLDVLVDQLEQVMQRKG